MTLVEILAACILFGVIMLAIVAFISFFSNSTVITRSNSEVHNEMRLIMMHITNEARGSRTAEIYDGVAAAPPSPSASDEVLFGFDATGNYSLTRLDPDGNIRFMPIPDLRVEFRVLGAGNNILGVTLARDAGDPKYNFVLENEILLPNLNPIDDINTESGIGSFLLIKLAE